MMARAIPGPAGTWTIQVPQVIVSDYAAYTTSRGIHSTFAVYDDLRTWSEVQPPLNFRIPGTSNPPCCCGDPGSPRWEHTPIECTWKE